MGATVAHPARTSGATPERSRPWADIYTHTVVAEPQFTLADRKVTDPLVPFRRVSWEYLEPYTHTVTDAAGAFRFERLNPGTYRLTARVPDAFQDGAAWDVDAGETGVTLRLAMEEGAGVTLRGVVLGPAGEAVTTFQVVPVLVDERGGLGATKVYSFEDAQGRFEIQGLEPGVRMILVRSDGFEEAVLEPADYRRGVNSLTIELSRGEE